MAAGRVDRSRDQDLLSGDRGCRDPSCQWRRHNREPPGLYHPLCPTGKHSPPDQCSGGEASDALFTTIITAVLPSMAVFRRASCSGV